jgi:hypothetical protein
MLSPMHVASMVCTGVETSALLTQIAVAARPVANENELASYHHTLAIVHFLGIAISTDQVAVLCFRDETLK